MIDEPKPPTHAVRTEPHVLLLLTCVIALFDRDHRRDRRGRGARSSRRRGRDPRALRHPGAGRDPDARPGGSRRSSRSSSPSNDARSPSSTHCRRCARACRISSPTSEHPWFAVSSARGREGKSFVAVHLVVAAGRAGEGDPAPRRQRPAPHGAPTARARGCRRASKSSTRPISAAVMQRTAREHLGLHRRRSSRPPPGRGRQRALAVPVEADRRPRRHPGRRHTPDDGRGRNRHLRGRLRRGPARHRCPPARLRRRRTDVVDAERPPDRGARRRHQPSAPQFARRRLSLRRTVSGSNGTPPLPPAPTNGHGSPSHSAWYEPSPDPARS